jgi:hypothetical protein
VLYFEFENINGADRSVLKVVDNDGEGDLSGLNSENRAEKKRELEAKLILGSYFKGWTFAENFIAETNVKHAPYEFGYAIGVCRPLALAARPERCNICPENFQAGVEVYGGLSTHEHFGLTDTSHYVAPTVAWTFASSPRFTVSPTFGVTETRKPRRDCDGNRSGGARIGVQVPRQTPILVKLHEQVRQAGVVQDSTAQLAFERVLAVELRY